MLNARIVRRVVPAVVLLLACGGGDLVLPSEGEPATLEVVQGNGQSGRVGSALAEPIVARVTDSQDRPVTDAAVAFVLDAAAGDATVAPDTARTDAGGLATFELVMGTRIGPAGAVVQVATAGGQRTLSEPVVFTAVSADANELLMVGGDGQSAPGGAALGAPLVVQVTDAFGNPIAGVPISWTPDGGGSVSEPTTTTGEDGLASVIRTLGTTAGPQQTSAGAAGLAGSPVVFSHTATAGAATVLELVSGTGQSTLVGTSVPDPLVVKATDGTGNPVAGLAVSWVVGTGGGSLSPATSTTGADGLTSTRWTVGPAPGANTATAVVSGVGTVEFAATAVPGTPPSLTIETQPSAEARFGIALSQQPVIQLREPDGAPRAVAGVRVSVSVVQGGAVLRGSASRTTGADGRVAFTDLALLGAPGAYTLAFAAAGYTGAASTPIALLRALTATTIRSDEPDPSIAGAGVPVRYQVQSSGGTPTGNVRISSDDGATCTGTVAAGQCTIVFTGVGARVLTAVYGGDTQFEPSTDTEAHRVDAPAPPVLGLVTQPSPTAVVGQPLPRQPVVQLRNAQGTPLPVAGVAVTVALASGPGVLAGTLTRTTAADGQASFTDLAIGGATGRHTLQFTAVGYNAVTSDPVEVGAAPPATTSTVITAVEPTPSVAGQPVTVRYTVTSPAGTPVGNVTVTASPAESCTGTVAAGSCALTLTGVGSRTLIASFAAQSGFAGSADTATQTVVAPPPPPPAEPSPTRSTVTVVDASFVVGGSTTVVVIVRDANGAPLPNVAVALTASGGGNTISTPQQSGANGEAAFTFGSSEVGEKTLTAMAGGITLAADPTITVTPVGTTTTITSDAPDPSTAGDPITVAYTVTSGGGTPAGSVTVSSSGGGSCTATVAVGSCALVPAGAEAGDGSVTLTATFTAAGNFGGSSDQEAHAIQAVPPPPPSGLVLLTEPSSSALPGVAFAQQPQIQLQSAGGVPINQPGVSVTAVIASGSGALAGQFSRTTDANGRATFTDLAINGAEGDFTIRFEADGFTSVTSGTVAVRRAGTTTSITSDDPEPSAVGEAVTVTFEVDAEGGTPAAAGLPTGTVTVSSDEGVTCSVSVSAGSCTLSFTAAGDHTLTADYAGDTRFEPSTAATPHTVSAPDQPPTGAADAFTGTEDQSLVVPAPGVLGNDRDPEGRPIHATAVAAPAHGQLALGSTGGLTYTPSADFAGTDGFTYRVDDGALSSSPVTVTVTVAPVNDPPSFTAGPDQSVVGGAGVQVVNAWATEVSPGPADEQDQGVRFEVEVVSGGALFADPPAVTRMAP